MPDRAVVDETVQFRSGNLIPYGQDFGFNLGVPSGVVFTIAGGSRWQEDGVWKLVAEGYGMMGKPNSYGSGALYVRCKDVEAEDLITQEDGHGDIFDGAEYV